MTGTQPKRFPTPDEFERQLVHFINVTLLGGKAAVDRDTRLFEDGYMNSLRILDLIAVVEKTLGRRVPDRSVRLANFRTIGAIVQAFHPEAYSQPPAAQDKLFVRRTNRSRFASPIETLCQRGDLHLSGAGTIALSGVARDLFDAVDLTVTQWARALGAPEHRYPSLIDLNVLERAGQLESFPQHLTRVSPGDGAALSPAVCYHAYPEWTGKSIGPTAECLTARGRCYRYEGGNYAPLERLWEFTMREIIVLGTREQVEETRQSLVRHVQSFVEMLDLDCAIETASDPFFAAGDEGRRLMQQVAALKYELRLTVDANGRHIAAASFNHHYDFFGTRFGVQLADDAPAHTGCIAFGLERWVLGLLSQHGVDEGAWPANVRTWLDESRRELRV